MALLRRPLVVASAIMAAALGVALVALALGADPVSLVLGAAVAAAAFALAVAVSLAPRRQQRRRERRAGRQSSKEFRRTRRAIHAAERRLFDQLEALTWLRDELALERPLPPTRGHAVAPDALRELVRVIDRTRPQQVLELGSGVSTIVMAARLRQSGQGRLVALEHIPTYAAATRQELESHGLTEVASVIDAPLVRTPVRDADWSWYELGPAVPDGVDLLFVDGPPGDTARLARYPALPMLRDRLAPGALVFVDDGARRDEREMVRRWGTEVDGLDSEYLALARGAWLLTMPD